jgi:septal ring factor EnvC (AmiA/AmiB activator)
MEGEARALRKLKEQSEAIQEMDRILAEKDREIEEIDRKIAESGREIQELKARIRAMQESAGKKA